MVNVLVTCDSREEAVSDILPSPLENATFVKEKDMNNVILSDVIKDFVNGRHGGSDSYRE